MICSAPTCCHSQVTHCRICTSAHDNVHASLPATRYHPLRRMAAPSTSHSSRVHNRTQTPGTEVDRLARLSRLLEWGNPEPGSFYDNLGSTDPAADAPRLDTGVGPLVDPSFYESTLQGQVKFNASARSSWSRFGEVFYDNKLVLRYTGLSSSSNYTLRLAEYPGGA